MLTLELPFYAAVALAGVGGLLGQQLVRRSALLRRYFIPEPVVGGLLVAIALLLARLAGVNIEVPTSGASVDFLVALLTTNMGLHVTPRLLRQGLPLFAVFLTSAVALAAVQLLLALPFGYLHGEPLRSALIAGPLSLVGAPFNLNPPSQTEPIDTLFKPAFAQLADTAQGVMMIGVLLGVVLAGLVGRRLFEASGEQPPEPAPSDQTPRVQLARHAARETGVLVLILVLISVAFGLQSLLLQVFPGFHVGYLPVIVLSYLLGAVTRLAWSGVRGEGSFPERGLTVLLLGPTMYVVLTYAIMVLPLHKIALVPPALIPGTVLAVAASAGMAALVFRLLRRLTQPYFASVIATAFLALTTAWGPIGMSYLRRFTDAEGKVEPMPVVMPLNAFYVFPWAMVGFTRLVLWIAGV